MYMHMIIIILHLNFIATNQFRTEPILDQAL